MRRLIAILLFYVIPFLALCQHGNNWTLGINMGLNFSTSPPSLFSADTSVNAYKQSISNCKGDLMFYGNRNMLWNRYHHRVFNDSVLNSKMQRPYFFIPCPGDDSSYYYISTGAKIVYVILDLRLDSGRGGIRNNKCIQIGDSTSLYSGFVKHANDTNYWLLVKYRMIKIYICTHAKQ
mgnify:CR=1 FL=1